MQHPSAWSCLVQCQLYWRKPSHEQTRPQPACPPDTGFPSVTHYWWPGGYGNTALPARCKHSTGRAILQGFRGPSTERALRVHRRGKRQPAGPRGGAGAACRAGGRCAVPGRARRSRQVLAQPLLLGRPWAPAMPLPERPSPASAAPSPRLGRPEGRRGGEPAWAGPPCRATGGDWCRQGVRHPRSARSGSRDRRGGGRGGALGATAPPPAPQGRPGGRLGSTLAREPAWGPGPPAPTYRLPPDPRPPLRRARRSNMAARGAPEAPPVSASRPFPRPEAPPPGTERIGPAPRPAPRCPWQRRPGPPRAGRGRRRRKRRGRKRRRHQVTGSVPGR